VSLVEQSVEFIAQRLRSADLMDLQAQGDNKRLLECELSEAGTTNLQVFENHQAFVFREFVIQIVVQALDSRRALIGVQTAAFFAGQLAY
jgi:hypothetical protein